MKQSRTLQRGWGKPQSEVKALDSRHWSTQVLTLLPSYIFYYEPTLSNLPQRNNSLYYNHRLLSIIHVPIICKTTTYNEPTRDNNYIYLPYQYVPRSIIRPKWTLSLAVCRCVCPPRRTKPATSTQLLREKHKPIITMYHYSPIPIKILLIPKPRNICRCLLKFKKSDVTILSRRTLHHGGPRPWYDCSRTSYRRIKTRLLSTAHLQLAQQGRPRPWNDCPKTSYRRSKTMLLSTTQFKLTQKARRRSWNGCSKTSCRRYKGKKPTSILSHSKGPRREVLRKIVCKEVRKAKMADSPDPCNLNITENRVKVRQRVLKPPSGLEPGDPTHECYWSSTFPLHQQYTSTELCKHTRIYSKKYTIYKRSGSPRTLTHPSKKPYLKRDGNKDRSYDYRRILADRNCTGGPKDDCCYLDNG